MMSKFNSIAEYQSDIKRRYPLGVPFITPYEAFCRHHYNFDVIARDYELQPDDNSRPIRIAPFKMPIPMPVIIPRNHIEQIKGVEL